jgi:hypothetical protein
VVGKGDEKAGAFLRQQAVTKGVGSGDQGLTDQPGGRVIKDPLGVLLVRAKEKREDHGLWRVSLR